TLGYGSSAPINEATTTYNANGQVATLADGASHLFTYAYDGYNRLSRLYYPNTSGSGSSSSDYEEFTYNNAGDVLSVRRRDAATISNTYDYLHRLTQRDPPGTSLDTTYTYDNFGRVLSEAMGGNTYSLAYDALGRVASETQPLGTVSYQYDLAGQRTR